VIPSPWRGRPVARRKASLNPRCWVPVVLDCLGVLGIRHGRVVAHDAPRYEPWVPLQAGLRERGRSGVLHPGLLRMGHRRCDMLLVPHLFLRELPPCHPLHLAAVRRGVAGRAFLLVRPWVALRQPFPRPVSGPLPSLVCPLPQIGPSPPPGVLGRLVVGAARLLRARAVSAGLAPSQVLLFRRRRVLCTRLLLHAAQSKRVQRNSEAQRRSAALLPLGSLLSAEGLQDIAAAVIPARVGFLGGFRFELGSWGDV